MRTAILIILCMVGVLIIAAQAPRIIAAPPLRPATLSTCHYSQMRDALRRHDSTTLARLQRNCDRTILRVVITP